MRAVCGIGIFLLLVATGASAQTRVETIQVDSFWGGLGPHQESHLTIARKVDAYEANGLAVDEAAVERLLEAIREKSIPAPDAVNLGVTADWLQKHAEQAGKAAYMLNYEKGTVAQRKLFRTRFVGTDNVAQRLHDAYRSFHTDDYPGIRIAINLTNAKTLLLSSRSQNPFMLPWKVSVDGTVKETYNENISHTLAKLLPEKFTNLERLADEDGLAELLGQDIGNSVESQWKMLGSEQVAGAALGILRRTYDVRTAEIGSYFQLAYGKEWKGDEPGEENLHVNLWHPGLPKNFVIAGTLLRKGGVVQGAANVAEQATAYERVVFDVPWWRGYFQKHPDEAALLYLVHGRSLSDRTMRIFAADMKIVGRPDLALKVQAMQSQVALLQTGRYPEIGQGDYWIVLPDRTTILWRWQSPHQVLGWEAKSLPAKECSSDGTVTGGCAGVVISPEGDRVK